MIICYIFLSKIDNLRFFLSRRCCHIEVNTSYACHQRRSGAVSSQCVLMWFPPTVQSERLWLSCSKTSGEELSGSLRFSLAPSPPHGKCNFCSSGWLCHIGVDSEALVRLRVYLVRDGESFSVTGGQQSTGLFLYTLRSQKKNKPKGSWTAKCQNSQTFFNIKKCFVIPFQFDSF